MSSNQPPKMAAACPHCGAKLRLLPEHLTESFRCPKCNTSISVAPKPPPLPAEAPRADDPYEIADTAPKPASGVKIIRQAKPGETGAKKKPEIQIEEAILLEGKPRAGDVLEPQEILAADYLESTSYRHDPTGDEDEYELEPHVEPPPLPVHVNEPLGTIERRAITADPLPPRPRWAFFSGVFTFPFYLGTLSALIFMSLGLCITSELVWVTAQNFGYLGGMTETSVLFAGFCGIQSVWIGVFTFAYVAAYCQATMLDTAEGHDVIHSWPDLGWREAFWSLPLPMYMTFLGIAAGYVIGASIGTILAIPAGVFFLFPILLLSALEADRVMIPYSPAVLASLRDQAWLWLGFFAETAVLAVVWLGPILWGMERWPGWTLAISAPWSAAMLLIYARLFGRLAWRIGEEVEDRPRNRGRADSARRDEGSRREEPAEPRRRWFTGRRKSKVLPKHAEWQDEETDQWLENPVPQPPPAPPTATAAPLLPPPPTRVRRE